MKRGFTLIELIVVIIIVGILAAVGMDQYSKMVEKSRGAEARTILGQITKFAQQFYFEHGAITDITNADVNVGTDSDQVPVACRTSHYFRYRYCPSCGSNPTIGLVATRCTSGGKSPQATVVHELILTTNLSTGASSWSGGGWY